MINRTSVALRKTCTGFTLVEAIVVIVITGILAGMVAVFIKAPVEGYVDSMRRAELTDAADTALRRIARDVRTALPNSFRLVTPTGSNCVEFLPTVGGGRYRAAPTVLGDSAGVLDFSKATISAFDVLANINLLPSFSAAGTQHVVIYNLGLDYIDADAYVGANRAQINNATATNTNITLTTPKKFPHESPGKRFQVILNNSVIYSCVGGANGSIFRSTPVISGVPGSCPVVGSGSVLVSNVDCANTSFRYSPVSASNSLLAMTLTLTRSGESVRIYHEVQVSNVP